MKGSKGCNFCGKTRVFISTRIHGLKRSKGELVFYPKIIIKSCKWCFDRILKVSEDIKKGRTRSEKIVTLLIKEFHNTKKGIEAYELISARWERRERMGIITP